MRSRKFSLGVSILMLACGWWCTRVGDVAPSGPVRPAVGTTDDEVTKAELDAGYALLHDLLGDLHQLPSALAFEWESDRVETVLTENAARAGVLRGRLERYGGGEDGIDFESMRLPVIDARARDSIADAKAEDFVLPGGPDVLEIVLAQISLLEYGRHVMLVLAEADPHEARTTFLEESADEFDRMRDRSLELVRIAD